MLNKEECILLLTIIKESTFKGEHLERIYRIALKLQEIAKMNDAKEKEVEES